MFSGKKKNQPKRNLSPLQQKRLFRITLILIACALLWIFLAPGAGIVSLWSKHNKLEQLEHENIELTEKNKNLHSKIDRLQNDPAYLEEVARGEFEMLKKDEQVFVFPSAKKKQDDD